MKELSIEEKAKAYDKAIEKAKNCLKDGTITNTAISYIETIFPELKESEDERIRKELVQFFKEKDEEDFEEWVSKAKVLAWLEKQGEQKSAWSEEDDAMLDKVIKRLHKYSAEDEEYLNKYYWLKELKHRVQPQPKQEWSKEGKRKMYRIYSILGQAADTHAFSTTCRLIGDKECIELQDFLKALIPQSTWKPSDEQIKAVKEAACYSSVFSEKTIDNLISLSKDLKNLK